PRLARHSRATRSHGSHQRINGRACGTRLSARQERFNADASQKLGIWKRKRARSDVPRTLFRSVALGRLRDLVAPS
ncbi:MAG: hypothetical protein AAF566_08785, partial [Pseudomonadota bacterium]